MLGFLDDERAVGALSHSLLNAKEDYARWAAAEGLLRRKDRRSIEPLIRALDDPAPKVRLVAATALYEFGDSRAIEPLNRLLLTHADDVATIQIATKAIRRLVGQRED